MGRWGEGSREADDQAGGAEVPCGVLVGQGGEDYRADEK